MFGSGLRALVALSLFSVGCNRAVPGGGSSAQSTQAAQNSSPPAARTVRATGIVQAVRFSTVQVPQISGQGGRLTLTKLIPNGVMVKSGDLLAEFDRTEQLDAAREAQAKYQDLQHQVEEQAAKNRADAAKRDSDLHEADADLAKAGIQLRKGPLLSEIDRLKAEAKAADAREHVASLKISSHAHDVADAATLRILELQSQRQKVNWDRALNNAQKLQLRAPLAGMVALENVWRNNSMGHPQEGDQLWNGQPLVRIFDPSEMQVQTRMGEPDGAILTPGCAAQVRLDAYPDLTFPAHLVSASPAASSDLGSPIKMFAARFRLDVRDSHLLPDLSAAVVFDSPVAASPPAAAAGTPLTRMPPAAKTGGIH